MPREYLLAKSVFFSSHAGSLQTNNQVTLAAQLIFDQIVDDKFLSNLSNGGAERRVELPVSPIIVNVEQDGNILCIFLIPAQQAYQQFFNVVVPAA